MIITTQGNVMLQNFYHLFSLLIHEKAWQTLIFLFLSLYLFLYLSNSFSFPFFVFFLCLCLFYFLSLLFISPSLTFLCLFFSLLSHDNIEFYHDMVTIQAEPCNWLIASTCTVMSVTLPSNWFWDQFSIRVLENCCLIWSRVIKIATFSTLYLLALIWSPIDACTL